MVCAASGLRGPRSPAATSSRSRDGSFVIGTKLTASWSAGSATFGFGEPLEKTQSVNANQTIAVFARYNADGTLAWARSRGSSDDKPSQVAVYADGTIAALAGTRL